MAVEDRSFYEHHGISPRSLLRATVANVRAGGVVQGGSTLTQQLVKNFFLSNERTLQRKLNEAVMSLLLEVHYSKDEILEAYLNEVYLGQDGSRAVHGLGLASHFYFERPLDQLEPAAGRAAGGHDQRSLLLRPAAQSRARQGASRSGARHAGRAGRAHGGAGRCGQGASRSACCNGRRSAANAHPAFLDMVRRQLRSDYREEDLTSEGLRIFTTFDPLAQSAPRRRYRSGWRVSKKIAA